MLTIWDDVGAFLSNKKGGSKRIDPPVLELTHSSLRAPRKQAHWQTDGG